MTDDIVYSLLIQCSWFFLGGWTLALLLATAAVFSEEFK